MKIKHSRTISISSSF